MALLQTARLALRELTLADFDDLLRLGRDEAVTARLLDLPLDNRLHVSAFIHANAALYVQRPGLGNWHARDEHGASVGVFSLMPVDGTDDVEIGARLLPSVWNRGLAVEGGQALCRQAFGPLGLPRLLGFCRADNAAVPTVLRRLGFEDRGTNDYAEQPALAFLLTRERWAALHLETSVTTTA